VRELIEATKRLRLSKVELSRISDTLLIRLRRDAVNAHSILQAMLIKIQVHKMLDAKLLPVSDAVFIALLTHCDQISDLVEKVQADQRAWKERKLDNFFTWGQLKTEHRKLFIDLHVREFDQTASLMDRLSLLLVRVTP